MSDPPNLDAALEMLRTDQPRSLDEAAATLVRSGKPAVPALLELLRAGGSADTQARVLFILSEIADSRASAAFETALESADARARAYAARGLFRLRHPAALEALVKTLDDAPDELHGDRTPSVDALGEMGSRAVPSLLSLLDEPNEPTRMHAQRALEAIVNRRFGFKPGRGFPSAEAGRRAGSAWAEHGDYNFAAPPASRRDAMAKLRAWFKSAPGEFHADDAASDGT